MVMANQENNPQAAREATPAECDRTAEEMRTQSLHKFLTVCHQFRNNPEALQKFVSTWSKILLRDYPSVNQIVLPPGGGTIKQ